MSKEKTHFSNLASYARLDTLEQLNCDNNECKVCQGYGQVYKKPDYLAGGEEVLENCTFCDGEGQFHRKLR